MVRLVVFDCDGTLVDSQHAVVEAMRAAFTGFGREAPAPAAIRRTIGLSLPVAMAELWPEGSRDDWEALTAGYRTTAMAMRGRGQHHEPLYPGAAETIAALDDAGYLLGVATGKSQRGLRATLERFNLTARFVTLQTADDAPSKPHPAMLRQAMAEAGAAPGETVLVGDTVFDIEMALNAGAAAIGVSWGYHATEDLHAAGAHLVVDSFPELSDAIAKMAGLD